MKPSWVSEHVAQRGGAAGILGQCLTCEEDVLDSRNNPGDACHPGLERERAGLVTAQSIPNVLERELPHVA